MRSPPRTPRPSNDSPSTTAANSDAQSGCVAYMMAASEAGTTRWPAVCSHVVVADTNRPDHTTRPMLSATTPGVTPGGITHPRIAAATAEATVGGVHRPAAAAAAGVSFKITFASRAGHERHACSQCPQSAHFALQPCACVFGLLHISNYIQEMAVGAGAASRSWANLMPNSLAVVWAAPAADPDGWWMEYFTQRRGGQMRGVVVALAVGLGVCGAGIAYLRHQERKEDWEERRERSERVSLFNFAAF
eukprot:contig_21044_g5162